MPDLALDPAAAELLDGDPGRSRRGRKARRPRDDGPSVEARVWCDGSCDTRGRGAAWGAVAVLPDGSATDGSGWLGERIGSTESEILAVARALSLIPDDMPAVVYTDCRSLGDRQRASGVTIDLPSMGELARLIASRAAPVRIVWRRRRSSAEIVAAHHLANAARLIGAIARGRGRDRRPARADRDGSFAYC